MEEWEGREEWEGLEGWERLAAGLTTGLATGLTERAQTAVNSSASRDRVWGTTTYSSSSSSSISTSSSLSSSSLSDVLAGLEPGDEVPVGGHGPQPVQELLRLGLVRRRSLAPELGLEYIIPRPDVAGCNILQLFLARSRPRWNMWCSGTCEGGE